MQRSPFYRGIASRLATASARLPGWSQLALRIAALVAALTFAERVLMRVTHLSAASYEQPMIVAGLLRQFLSPGLASLVTIGFALGLVGVGLWRRSLGPRWESMERGRRLQALVLVAAGALAWSYATYGYNAYFDQAHLFDRLLLVIGLGLVAWRPVFIWPFVLVLLPIAWQFTIPIGGASWAEPLLLVRVLIVVATGYLLRALTERLRTADILFVVFTLIASHYWISGVGKLELDGWLAHDRIYYMLPSSYAAGWLSFLEPTTLDTLIRWFAPFNLPLKAFTILVEAGAILALVRRGWLRFFLVGWILLHLGIFLTSGFFFWRWMLLEAALLLLFVGPRRIALPIFTPTHFVLSLVLVVGSAVWYRPVKLAWHDVRVSYTFRFEAETADGTRYTLPPRFFEPYGYQFTLGTFRYLVEEKRLAIAGGGTWQQEAVDALPNVTTPDALWDLEAEHGKIALDPKRAARLDAFLRDFVPTRAERMAPSLWSYLQAPPILVTLPYQPSWLHGAEIERVIVTHITGLYDDERYRTIRAEPIRTVEIDATPAVRRP